MPTVVHGLLQQIIMRLLFDAKLISATEVELRVDPEAHPRPDVMLHQLSFPSDRIRLRSVEVAVE